MKDTAIVFGWAAGAAIFVAVLSLGVHAFYAPASVAIDNATFHQSQSYQDGMANDLSSFQQDYANATTPEKKATIRAIVVARFASYTGPLPLDLRAFLNQMKTGG